MVDPSRASEISRLSELLSNNPNSRLFVPLAEAYLQADAHSDAISVLSEGLKKHGNFVAARVMLGKIHLKKADFQAAKTQFIQVLDIAPSNIPSLKGLAAVHREEGLLTDALSRYKTVLKVDPTDREAGELMDEVKLALADTAKAEKEKAVKNASAVEPEKPQVEHTPEIESEPVAVEPLTAPPIDIEPEEDDATAAVATQTLAGLYLQQEHYEEAIDIYEKLLEETPTDVQSQAGLKKALSMMKESKMVPVAVGAPLSTTEKIDRLQSWLDAIEGDRRK